MEMTTQIKSRSTYFCIYGNSKSLKKCLIDGNLCTQVCDWSKRSYVTLSRPQTPASNLTPPQPEAELDGAASTSDCTVKCSRES